MFQSEELSDSRNGKPVCWVSIYNNLLAEMTTTCVWIRFILPIMKIIGIILHHRHLILRSSSTCCSSRRRSCGHMARRRTTRRRRSVDIFNSQMKPLNGIWKKQWILQSHKIRI
jgi:hypothetical protein